MSWIPLHQLLLAPDEHRPVAVSPAMNHAAFSAHCLTIAGALNARSARRAGLWFLDAAELGIALLACWRAGVTAVLPGNTQSHTLATLDADVDLWLSDEPLSLPRERCHALSDLSGHAPLPAAALNPDIGGLEIYTSGSSGHPKLIIKRWAQLCHEIQALENQWNWSASHACVMGSVGTQHMYGLPFRVLWPLCAGRSIERTQLAYPEAIQNVSLRHERFVWISSPALLRRLGNDLQWPTLANGIAQVFSAGGALPPNVSDTLHTQLNCRPTEIYGSSETGVMAWRQGDTAWQTLPPVIASTASNGALRAQSPWIRPDDEQTSDAVEFQHGGFHLLGRLDRIVKIEEKRIALPMLEQTLALHPYIEEARVGRATGAPRLTALVALSPAGQHALRNGGRKALVQTLQRHLSTHFEPLAIPRAWRFMDQLPWNAQNKLPQQAFDTAAGPLPLMPDIISMQSDDVDERRYTLKVPADLAHFSGHFTATPVVPGVAQIGWAMTLAKQDLQPEFNFGGLEALKFQRLMRPCDKIDLQLRWNAAQRKLYFDFRFDGAPCSSGRIIESH